MTRARAPEAEQRGGRDHTTALQAHTLILLEPACVRALGDQSVRAFEHPQFFPGRLGLKIIPVAAFGLTLAGPLTRQGRPIAGFRRSLAAPQLALSGGVEDRLDH